MPDFPIFFDGQRVEEGGADATDSGCESLTANATANTKGVWNQLIASTAFDASWIMINLSQASAGDRDYLVDIAIGAASSEQTIISNLLCGSGTGTAAGYVYIFPVAIAAGTRIAARAQSTVGSSNIYCNIHIFAGGFLAPIAASIVDTYGDNTADSGGTSIDPGGTVDTKGSYVQLTASTTRPVRLMAVAFSNQANATASTYQWLFDIAIGAASSEQIIIPDLAVTVSAGTEMTHPGVFCLLPIYIPAGTRIAVRSQCSGNQATERLLDIVIYGMN